MTVSNSNGTTENSFHIDDPDVLIKYVFPAVSDNNLHGVDKQGQFPLATILDRAHYYDANSHSVSNTNFVTIVTMPTMTALYTGAYVFQIDFRYYTSRSFDTRIRIFINGSATTLFDIEETPDSGTINKRMEVNLTQGDTFYCKVRVKSSSNWRSVDIDDVFISMILHRF